jgi:hypothetical protein
MLKWAASAEGGHPGILVYYDPAGLPPENEELPDGSIRILVGKRIYLPDDKSKWTSEVVSKAYDILASCELSDFSQLIWPGLRSIRITRDAFEAFCVGRGYELPGFWFGRPQFGKKTRSFVGRPSVMRRVEAEMRRRALGGTLATKLRDEAASLHLWAKQNVDNLDQVPGVHAIENALRDLYKRLRAPDASQAH